MSAFSDAFNDILQDLLDLRILSSFSDVLPSSSRIDFNLFFRIVDVEAKELPELSTLETEFDLFFVPKVIVIVIVVILIIVMLAIIIVINDNNNDNNNNNNDNNDNNNNSN